MKKKIIQVVPSFNVGGAESLVKNYLLNIDRERFVVEAFVTGKRLNTSIEKELQKKGIKITYLSDLYKTFEVFPNCIKRFQVSIGWRKAIKKYFSQAKPDVVHCHLSVARNLIAASSVLKGVKIFYTVHSDPDKYWENGKNADEQKAIRHLLTENNMIFIALHEDAISKIRKYFGDDCTINVLNNAVDQKAYEPTSDKRNRIRSELGINENAFVLGHVGRFLKVKNHSFLLDVFNEVHKKRPEAVLCLVGEGELKEATAHKSKELGIDKEVIFLGNRGDVPDILSAFDVFVFPSLWEGFPLTMIEAQAAQLPCFVSNRVSHEVVLTNLVEFIDVEVAAEVWANTILSYRKQPISNFRLSQYDIKNVINELLNLYGVDVYEGEDIEQ